MKLQTIASNNWPLRKPHPSSARRPLPGRTRFGLGEPFVQPGAPVDASGEDYKDRIKTTAHELRNALNGFLVYPTRATTAVNRFLEQFRINPAEADPKLLVQAVREMELCEGQVKDLVDLTDDTLNRKLDIRLMPFNANHLIGDTLDAFRAIKKYQRADYVFNGNGANLEAWGDPSKLRQVLQNLIKNALEATKYEGRIEVTAKPLNSHGGLELTVADNGPGIPVGIRDQLFTPYVSTKGEKGLGLGLAISKKIIEAQHGSLTVESQPGQGTRFIVTLPGKPPVEAEGNK